MRRHFTTLDGCRGLAAMAVALSHVLARVGIAPPPFAFLSLDFFFVLSGLVVAHAYRERLADGTLSPAAFVALRVVRLHPLLVLATATGFLAAIADATPARLPVLLAVAAMGLAMLPLRAPVDWPGGPLPRSLAFPLNGPSWSMFAEYWVNIAYALVARRLTGRWLGAALLASGAATAWMAHAYGTLSVGCLRDDGMLCLVRVAFPFLCGVAIQRVHAAGRLPRRSLPAALPCVLLLAIVLAPGTLPPVGFCLVAAFGLIPATVVAGLLAREAAGVAGRAMQLLGRLSYPLYALHMPVVAVLVLIAGRLAPGVPLRQLLPVLLLGPVVAAAVAARWFDEPLRAWIATRLAAQHPGPPRRAAPAIAPARPLA